MQPMQTLLSVGQILGSRRSSSNSFNDTVVDAPEPTNRTHTRMLRDGESMCEYMNAERARESWREREREREKQRVCESCRVWGGYD